jgi:hypothetical protein
MNRTSKKIRVSTKLGATALFVATTASCGVASRQEGAPARSNRDPSSPPATRPVDLAICLDTSGSMDGLIDAARQKLWAIVNDLALAKPAPKLRVALLTYGNDGHDAENGWVALDVPFTDDLDLVSAKLFALKTNGGTEYVARVLKAAGEQLDWSSQKDALELVFVCGNESAEQDPALNFRDVCRSLVERGIVVDSIYCGDPADEIAPAWQQVARCADGRFAAIDQQNGTVVISTPFDAELASLSTALNDTYVPYGMEGEEKKANQAVQDQNAQGLSSAAAAARATCKGGGSYRCSWDLVEAVKQGDVKLADVKNDELPEKMRELTLDARQKCVDDAWTKRQELQKKIGEASQKREKIVAEETAKQRSKDHAAFDRAVRDAVREQAKCKGFEFPKDESK